MTLDEYQARALETAVYTDWTDRLVCTALGLNGEAGEVAEKIKKVIRDQAWEFRPEDRESVLRELGDVLWYLAVLADTLDLSLEEVARVNLEKLARRKAAGRIRGSGDER